MTKPIAVEGGLRVRNRAERSAIEAQLYEAHAQGAYRLAYLLTGDRGVAADIVQDAFVRILGRLRRADSLGDVHAYLRTTVVNLARDRFRAQRALEKRRAREASLRRPDVTELPDVEQHEELMDRLRSLPVRQRAALVLHYYEDLSQEGTADALGCSTSAAKALITRGLQALREGMGEYRWT